MLEARPVSPDPPPRPTLAELARTFTWLGFTAFGGPAAHVALMDAEFVDRRRWLTREEFLELLGASQLLPGPNSTELAIHVGRRHRGLAGLVVAGACFVLPSAFMAAGLAELVVRHGRLPAVEAALVGMRPVVLAVVGVALVRFARTTLATGRAAAVAAASLAALLAGAHELVVLAGAALASSIAARPRASGGLAALAPAAAGAGAAVPFGLGAMFLFFLKVGAVLYGSGYVLLAFLRADLVERWGWLTDHQLLDAITVGQITPGPVFTTATYVGGLLAGPTGAAVATIGIFLPAFLFVAATAPLLAWLRGSASARAALAGVTAGSLALLVVVWVQLAREALTSPAAVGLAGVAAILLARTRVNPVWWMLAGALAGIVLQR